MPDVKVAYAVLIIAVGLLILGLILSYAVPYVDVNKT